MPHAMKFDRRHLLIAGLLTLAIGPAQAAEVVLFQPGQSAWEWLLVPSKHDGGKRIREGKTCLFCHEDEQRAIGNAMLEGHELEPSPIPGMPGFVEMTVNASYDDQNLYLSACWNALASDSPWGDEDAEEMFTVAIGTADLNVTPIAGCWAACHSDLPAMPGADPGVPLTKYLPGSRNKMTATGGGNDIRPEADLEAQLAENKYLEYWQLQLKDEQVVGATDGYFLDRRVRNADSAVTGSGQAGGMSCSLELVRPLAPGGKGRHELKEGVEYTIGIALHANHASGRHHYTSLPMRLSLGSGEAELVATRR